LGQPYRYLRALLLRLVSDALGRRPGGRGWLSIF
jgi:hypothetical protein